MKVTLESTTKIIALNGITARVWEGHTENGIAVHAFISRIAVHKDADLLQFENELQKCRPPSPEIESYPARIVL